MRDYFCVAFLVALMLFGEGLGDIVATWALLFIRGM